MANPISRAELKNYCLEQCGAPVITVNIADVQLNNAIDDALHYWQEYSVDAQERSLYQHTITATDIQNMYIEMPDNVLSVIKIYGHSSASSTYALFNAEYQIASDIILNLVSNGGGMEAYFLAKQRLTDLNFMFNPDPPFRFRVHNRRLYIDTDWAAKFVEDNKILIECYAYIDQDVFNTVWGNRHLKELAAAMVKKQWGSNLIKFNGVALAGGVTLNGVAIYESAIQEIEQIKEDIYQHQEPYGFIVA